MKLKKVGKKLDLNFLKLSRMFIQLLLLLLVLTGCIHERNNMKHNKPPITRTLDTDITIVLIHGMGSGPNAWGTAEKFLKAKGYRENSSYYKFDYSKTTDEHIKNNADRLRDWLKEKKIDKKTIALVGHSMGGLVARRAVVDDPTLNVVKLVTLASPNDGAKYAWGCELPGLLPGQILPLPNPCPPGVNDMKVSSKFLENLNYHSIPFNNTSRVMSYAIQGDGLVSISSSHIPNTLQKTVAENAPSYGSKSKVVDSNRGTTEVHSAIINKNQVLEDVLKFIQNKEGDALIVNGGPLLNHTECYWGSANGKVQWRLPIEAPDNLMMEIMEKSKIIKTASAKKEIIDGLSDGNYSARFYDPKTNKRSEFSAFYMEKSMFKCSSNYINNREAIDVWPGTDLNVRLKYSTSEKKLYVTIPSALFKGENRIIIKRNHKYVSESYRGTVYYGSKVSDQDGNIEYYTNDNPGYYAATYTASLVRGKPGESGDGEIRVLATLSIGGQPPGNDPGYNPNPPAFRKK